MRRPLIGVTTYLEPDVRWGHWRSQAALVPLSYVRAVEGAGGTALLVPPTEDGLDEVVEAIDGLIFSGGNDLDPASYDAEKHPATTNTVPERDRGELALLERALERDLPLLAVCRGSQILNVARGGDLVQHLPEVVGHESHRETPGVFSDHPVAIDADSRLGSIVGERLGVKSHHHQAFGRIGRGLVTTARAEDGTIEAFEDPDRRFCVGVLWHPEESHDLGLFEALVEQARAYRAEREGATA
jgi:putative glutamine amidotransferase